WLLLTNPPSTPASGVGREGRFSWLLDTNRPSTPASGVGRGRRPVGPWIRTPSTPASGVGTDRPALTRACRRSLPLTRSCDEPGPECRQPGAVAAGRPPPVRPPGGPGQGAVRVVQCRVGGRPSTPGRGVEPSAPLRLG